MNNLKTVRDYIADNSLNKKQILEYLDRRDKIGVVYYHLNNESGYFNLRVYSYDTPKEQGYLRVYEDNRGNIKTQMWTPCKMVYSGISTFPSARCR